MSARRLFEIAAQSIAGILIAAVLLLAAASLIGMAGGRSAVVITSGSMEPALPGGSLAVLSPVAAEDLEVDDVVTVQLPSGALLTHRISSLDRGAQVLLTTRGDANSADDPARFVAEQVVGRVEASVPLIGYVIYALRSPAGILLIVALVLLAAVLRHAARRGNQIARSRREILALPGLVSLSMLILFRSVLQSAALFTASAAAADNVFAVSNIDISAARSTISGTYTNMLPGDRVQAEFVISNTGEAPLRYAITVSADNPDGKGLASTLALTFRVKDANPCSARSGAVLAAPMTLSSATLGDPAVGAQPGDRSLGIGASESLCVEAMMPVDAPGSASNASTTAVFTFDAEQTGNNP